MSAKNDFDVIDPADEVLFGDDVGGGCEYSVARLNKRKYSSSFGREVFSNEP
jgi:hypothetical protein